MSSSVESSGRIERIFADLRTNQRKALMPFICAQHPTLGITPGLIEAIAHAGANIIEVGIPFSDPIADGPVIAAAMHQALVAGATPGAAFEAVRQVRDRVDVGLVAMVSVSIVHRLGADAFVSRAKDAGFDGFIFPDCPLEEASELSARAGDAGLTSTLLIAPTTSEIRAEQIAKACTGFVYLLARAGITGEREEAPDIDPRVSRIREWTDLPIACGFGISTAEHVRAVTRHADAAIVGSALVRRLSQAHSEHRDPIAEASQFMATLTEGLAPARTDP